VASHSLLNTNTKADIIMVQEPWYNKIGMSHLDTDPEGVNILNSVANPRWDCIYPRTNHGERCKVMAYHCISSTHFNITNHLDLASCHHILSLDIHLSSSNFWAINVYHDMEHHSSLDNILNIEMDPCTPTIIGGDFNTHSQMWSPPGIQPSPWADNLEHWAIRQNLGLASPLGILTQRGEGNQCDTTIDLIWTNTTALLDNAFQDPIINFTASIGSDHVGLWATYQHILKAAIDPPLHLLCFVIKDEA
jgi:endonuclease/exonuclease/phosphatase family metal-dependent hydrolase